MAMHSRWVGNLLRFFDGATDILDIDGANSAVDVKVAGGLKYAGTAIAATAAEINRAADVSARIVSATTATLSLTEATHDGKTVVLNRAAGGAAVTLPAASGSGARFRLVVGTALSSGTYALAVANASDYLRGQAWMANDTDASVSGWETANSGTVATESDTLTMDGTTKGGRVGDLIEIQDIAANVWSVRAHLTGSGTEATPFSAAV